LPSLNAGISNQHFSYSAGEFNGVLLGDRGYACWPYLLMAYPHPGRRAERAFNHAHAKTRAQIEMTLGQIKSRFIASSSQAPWLTSDRAS